MSTTSQIFSVIPKIMSDISAVAKSRTNTQQGFKFRGIDDLYNELHPLFAKHGLFTTTEILTSERFLVTTKSGSQLNYTVGKFRFKFFASDGSFVESVMIGEGSDSGDKSSNKAMAIAHKYALLQLFAIPTEDDKDPDAQSNEAAAAIDISLIQKHIEAALGTGKVSRSDISSYLSTHKIDRIGSMGFNQQKEFVKWLSHTSRTTQPQTGTPVSSTSTTRFTVSTDAGV